MTKKHKGYAEALYMLAAENQTEKEYGKCLKAVAEILDKNSAYIQLLSSPAIPMKERLNAMEQVFSKVVPEQILNFMLLLCKNNKIQRFSDYAKEYQNILDASEKVLTAKVVSAVSLTKGEKASLKEKLEKKYGHTILPEYSVDPTLIGGLMVELDGRMIDGSLRSGLRKIKDVISQ